MAKTWNTEDGIVISLRLVDGQVLDEYDQNNENIQQLAHILAKLPIQAAKLVIWFNASGPYERDWPGWVPSLRDAEYDLKLANLIPFRNENLDTTDQGIRIRPSLARKLFDTYLDLIKEVDLDVSRDDPDDVDEIMRNYQQDENVRKLARTITESNYLSKYILHVDLYMQDGVVYDDSKGETNDHIQQLSHIIARFPEQKALLTIKLKIWFDDMGIDDIDVAKAFIAPAGQLENGDLVPSGTRIKIRPKIVTSVINRYLSDIQDKVTSTPHGWLTVGTDNDVETDEDFWEDIQKLASIITEDPDIYSGDTR